MVNFVLSECSRLYKQISIIRDKETRHAQRHGSETLTMCVIQSNAGIWYYDVTGIVLLHTSVLADHEKLIQLHY